ncbi:MAG: HAD family phosphatase [Planctomycetota bacterium]|nr:MAG: HAD family phosphatase [Planctomycetota bacterium]
MGHEYPLPFSEVPASALASVRVIASDVDDTLTRGGEIPSEVIAALERLRNTGIDVLLVTGRSFGWGLAEKLYFPVSGVIAENGGVWIRNSRKMSDIYFHGEKNMEDFREIRRRMRKCLLEIGKSIPGTIEAVDNAGRITDLSFSITQDVDYTAAYGIAGEHGFEMFISSVAGHVTIPGVSKGNMLEHALRKGYGIDSFPTDQVLAIGDSTNDAALFDRKRFSLSVGVANVEPYLDALGENAPVFLTAGSAHAGFLEVASALLNRTPRQ